MSQKVASQAGVSSRATLRRDIFFLRVRSPQLQLQPVEGGCMAYCSACGNQVADGVAVCPACGKSVAGGAPAAVPGSSTATSGGLDQKIAGLLSYLFIPAIIFLVMEPYNRNPFIRFHAFQGLFLGLASILGRYVLFFIPVL